MHMRSILNQPKTEKYDKELIEMTYLFGNLHVAKTNYSFTKNTHLLKNPPTAI